MEDLERIPPHDSAPQRPREDHEPSFDNSLAAIRQRILTKRFLWNCRRYSTPLCVDGADTGKKLSLIMHPAPGSGTIIINYPGANGNIDGYNEKYKAIGHLLAESGVGGVVRIAGASHDPDVSLEALVKGRLQSTIRYALDNAEEASGKSAEEVKINLMGFSTGAWGVAATAHEFPQVEKILLIAPPSDDNSDNSTIRDALGLFEGEVWIAVGADDDVVGAESGARYLDLAVKAKAKRLFTISDCDHQFQGEVNGKILSSLPLWAFDNQGEQTPNPDRGVKLYD